MTAVNRVLVCAAAVLFAGCSTYGESGLVDFNKKFGQDVPTSPQFRVDRLAENRYQVVVYQGSAKISEATTRTAALQRAAFAVMEDHCTQLGAKLNDYSVNNQKDGWGYVNLLALFSCQSK